MERHVQLRHRNPYVEPNQLRSDRPSNNTYFPSSTERNSKGTNVRPNPITNNPLYEGMVEAADAAKGFAEFGKVLDELGKNQMHFQELNMLRQQVNYFRRIADSQARQLSDVYSNHWLVPKHEIQGVSGYFCESCKSFDWCFIRSLGYDLTAQGRHRCNNAKNGQSDSDWEQELLNRVNFYLPGPKFLICFDITSMFNKFVLKLDVDTAKKVLGVPERYTLHVWQEGGDLAWLKRVIDAPARKIRIDERETMDFIRKIKSTYSMLEIKSGSSVKIIAINLAGMTYDPYQEFYNRL